MPFDASTTDHDTPKFDVAALLQANRDNALELFDRHVNPAFAAVLRTIGFDAKFQRGQGAYLFDDKGNRYIDCLGGYAVFAAGRNHPVIRDALKQAMDLDLPNLPGVGTFRVAGLLARELVALAPKDFRDDTALDTCFFASGGAEAIDAAIKHAKAATERDRIVYCHRSYHGLTLGALSVTGNHEFREGFGTLGPTTEIAFNDLGALEHELKKGDVAAFICEPIQGKGVNIPADSYLWRVSELCHEHDALFILDEIQTGLGRTGRMFAGEHFGMGQAGTQGWCPDIMVIAKALSGGYVPVSCVLTKRWIHQKVFSSMNNCSRIQNTFSMNDLAMVAGLASLHVIGHEKIVENSRDVGEYLMDGLRKTLAKYDMVKEVRGRGLFIAIEFQRPRSFLLGQAWDMLHKLDPSLFCQAIILPLMSDHRIIAQVAGHRLDVIKLIPALVLSKADADEIIRAMDVCIGNCQKLPGPIYEVGKKLGSAAVRRMGSIMGTGSPAQEPIATA
ncbi:MAG TPA: aspartate aminotransferase family protein [Phycisphaerales bacterium]|nr:aspartate aminotransferase family protein [Phycisphaerales bacterium]